MHLSAHRHTHPTPAASPCCPPPQDFTAHIAQAHVASFATPREGSAPPYRFLFHAQAARSSARVLVQVRRRLGKAVALLGGAGWRKGDERQPHPGKQGPLPRRCRSNHLHATRSRPASQVTVSKAPPAATAVIKSDSPAAAQHVEELLQTLVLTL